ncbi:serine/threonine-protein kinase, partial [Actinocorallia lasiicapitis]
MGDPRAVGGYELIGRLGEGGQGVVYEGVSPHGERVAVKVLHTRFSGNQRARRAFARELRAARQVDPFCTARIIEADVDGEIPYIVSEFIEGRSLKQRVQSGGPLTGGELDRLAIGTVTALLAIHKAGIVHRDFKPSNVMIGADGPRVVDFGIARLLDPAATATSGAVGTPTFMAPEQLKAVELTTAVDVWAWAATLVYAASGHPPFGSDSISAVITRILTNPPDLGRLEGRLRTLAARCLVADPEDRPDAKELLLTLLSVTPAPGSLPLTARLRGILGLAPA